MDAGSRSRILACDVANETGEPVNGIVKWSLRLPDSSVVREGQFDVTVPAYGGTWLPHLDFNGDDPLKVHMEYALFIENAVVSSGTSLFCALKHYAFLDPAAWKMMWLR